MKKINLQLVAIILLAFFVRVYKLGVSFMHTDEAKTALGVDFPHSFVLPHLSHLSQVIIGANNFAARLPFALFGVLSVLIFYYIGKELYDKKRGLVFAFLAAFLPVNVLLSRTAFLDVALACSWALIVLFWIKYEKENSDKNLFFLFISLAISFWFKIQALYIFVALFLYLLVITRGRFWQDKRFYLLVLSVIPFGFYFLSQPQQIYDMMHYTKDEVGTNFSDLKKLVMLLMESYGIILLFALAGFAEMIRKKDFSGKKINIFFIIFLVLMLSVLLTTPKRIYYYVMFDMVAVFFCAYCFGAIVKKRFVAIIFMILVAVNFSFIIFRMNKGLFLQNERTGYLLCEKMNSLIDNTPEPKSVYWDTNFGFTYKWCTQHEVKKLDNLLKKEIYDKTSVIAVLDPLTVAAHPGAFSDFTIEEYQGVKILTRTIQNHGK